MSDAINQNWFNVTTWALRDWRVAQQQFWNGYRDRIGNERAQRIANDQLQRARADYRHRVLSWFWKLCAPIEIDECVPDEVALLLAEDWDERTKWRAL